MNDAKTKTDAGTLTYEDIVVLRYMVELYKNGQEAFTTDDIKQCLDYLNETEAWGLLIRLEGFGILSVKAETFGIQDYAFTVLDQIDNPPRKNHWKDFQDRFFSYKWSVALILIALVFLAVWKYREWLAPLFQWITSGMSAE